MWGKKWWAELFLKTKNLKLKLFCVSDQLLSFITSHFLPALRLTRQQSSMEVSLSKTMYYTHSITCSALWNLKANYKSLCFIFSLTQRKICLARFLKQEKRLIAKQKFQWFFPAAWHVWYIYIWNFGYTKIKFQLREYQCNCLGWYSSGIHSLNLAMDIATWW